MPYVALRDRKHIGDEQIQGLVSAVRSVPSGKREGALNYILTRIVLGALRPKSYTDIARAKAVFTEARDEVSRRLMGPREKQAIEDNGDLPEYLQLRKGP